MDRLEMIIVNEVSETDQDEYHMISPICGIKKKSDTDEHIYKTEIDSQT